MANSGDIWDVIHLFEQLQDENPSFQYSLKKNEIGKPEAVAWATAEMRRDLIRFGDSMFIDMRKTAVNKIPVIRNLVVFFTSKKHALIFI
jgi:hypothetical protein